MGSSQEDRSSHIAIQFLQRGVIFHFNDIESGHLAIIIKLTLCILNELKVSFLNVINYTW